MGELSEILIEPKLERASLPSDNPTKSFWQTSHPNPIVNFRSTSDLPRATNVVIVGSGITAAFIAQRLLEESKDLKIVVLEARTTCSGATGRNGGHLQPVIHDNRPGVSEFELSNFDFIDHMIEKYEIPCDFRKVQGCIGFWNKTYFDEAKAALKESVTESTRLANLARVVEDPGELSKLRLKNAVGAIVQSKAASLSPYKLIIWMWQNMIKRYSERLNLQTTTPALRLVEMSDITRAFMVQTMRGNIIAPHVILATNGYTSHLLPEFEGLITPTQGQMSALLPPSTFSDQLLQHSYGFHGVGLQDRVMSDYLVQNPLPSGGHLMFGGARTEVVGHGVGVSDDSFVDPAAESYLRHLPVLLDLDRQISNAENSDEAKIHVQHTKLDLTAVWTGIMGYSRDHFPWVGGLPDREGLWLCAGYTGHGMPNASGCAQHLAKLVLAATAGQDWQEVEKHAVAAQEIPHEYILSRSRLGYLDLTLKLS